MYHTTLHNNQYSYNHKLQESYAGNPKLQCKLVPTEGTIHTGAHNTWNPAHIISHTIIVYALPPWMPVVFPPLLSIYDNNFILLGCLFRYLIYIFPRVIVIGYFRNKTIPIAKRSSFPGSIVSPNIQVNPGLSVEKALILTLPK